MIEAESVNWHSRVKPGPWHLGHPTHLLDDQVRAALSPRQFDTRKIR